MKKIGMFLVMTCLFLGESQALPNPFQDKRVQQVYEHFQGKLLWIQGQDWNACAKTLLQTLSHVEEEGLWIEDYEPFVKELDRASFSTREEKKKADALLTLAALNYISDMKGERLNPRAADRSIHIKQVTIDEAKLLQDYLSLPDQCGWLYTLAPSLPDYHHFKTLLSLYRQKKALGEWPQLPLGTELKLGNKGSAVETLRAQLIDQDVLPSQGQGSDVFDEHLEKAVKSYQTLHGLESDGVVGPQTLKALNTPVDDRIRAIILALERLRWLPNPLPSRYIQVNIPGFYLRAVEGGKIAFDMDIITGKHYTKTPTFNAPMTEIIFNPSWHVPASIVPELLPKIERNPGAYAKKGYHVSYDSGVRIVQSPGKGNALGKIRFTLKNPFSIYLHGTPQQKLFDKAKRSFSHGCIRVEYPDKLADFVFNAPQTWPLSRIQKEASGHRTKHVKLEKALPVFITYFTVFEDQEEKTHFVPDIYGQDKKLWQALEKARRFKESASSSE